VQNNVGRDLLYESGFDCIDKSELQMLWYYLL